MLFNRFAFLLVFLPHRSWTQAAVEHFPRAWLASLLLMSIAFYDCWDWRSMPLLLASIGFD